MTSKKTQETLAKRTKMSHVEAATTNGVTNPATSTPPEVSEREATSAYFRILIASHERIATALERIAAVAERGHGLAVEQARREVAAAADAGTTHNVEVVTVPPGAAKTTEAPGLKQAQQAFLDYVARHDKAQAAAVLKRFGAARVSELPPAQYGPFIAALAE